MFLLLGAPPIVECRPNYWDYRIVLRKKKTGKKRISRIRKKKKERKKKSKKLEARPLYAHQQTIDNKFHYTLSIS